RPRAPPVRAREALARPQGSPSRRRVWRVQPAAGTNAPAVSLLRWRLVDDVLPRRAIAEQVRGPIAKRRAVHLEVIEAGKLQHRVALALHEETLEPLGLTAADIAGDIEQQRFVRLGVEAQEAADHGVAQIA